MKISDDELAQLQKLFADADKVYLESNKCHWQTSKRVSPEVVAAALVELQQYREERRWRKVSEELPEILPNVVQVEVWKSGMIRPVMMDVPVLLAAVKIGKFGANDVFEYYWRPLPMDLPEEVKCR